MKFTLHYQGELLTKTNKKHKKHKHSIRDCFRLQLEDLWKREPLKSMDKLIAPKCICEEQCCEKCMSGCHSDCCKCAKVVKKVIDTSGHAWNFASIVSKKHHMIARLEIVLLRPEEPRSGARRDIDNRLKTLFDALQIPKQEQEIPDEANPMQGDDVFHCLLEDDSLITSIDVKTDHLLGSVKSKKEVLIIMQVHVSTTKGTLDNLEISI